MEKYKKSRAELEMLKHSKKMAKAAAEKKEKKDDKKSNDSKLK